MPESAPAPEPRWDVPFPYGYAAAIDSMGSVSAPLLAGFSVTLAVFVIQSGHAFRWATASLLLFVSAALALIAALQFTFRARQFAVSPPELEAWWADAGSPARREMLRREQRYYRRQHGRWATRARRAYSIGILSFLLGVPALLVPSGGIHPGRLAVISLALLGCAGEIAWIVQTELADSQARDWPPPPGPELES
jgi:hypothetical protein